MSSIATLGGLTSIFQSCLNLGVPRATYYRRRRSNPNIKARRPHPATLSAVEREVVLREVNSPRFCDLAIPQVFTRLLDEGRFLCSVSSMYRILGRSKMVQDRRRQVPRAHYPRPELLATGPNQIWSWDITKLKGPQKWTYFYLYVMMDIFSRYVVGWLVADRESSDLAKAFIEDCCERQNIKEHQLTIHADRGSSMKSKPVAHLLADLGVTKSHSRPQVSNDNPFSEANFKTLKYRPDFPDRFGSIIYARNHCGDFFPWYNEDHHHSGIAMLTPSDLHYGRGAEILKARYEIMLKAFTDNPARFNGRIPKMPELPTAVWINKPNKKAETAVRETYINL